MASTYNELNARSQERSALEGATHFTFIAPRDRSAWGKLFEDHIRYQQQPSEKLLEGCELELFQIARAELTAEAKEGDVTIKVCRVT